MTGQNSTTPFTRSRTVSVQEQSSYELTTATRSPNDPAETLERVNAVLALYFETGLAPDVKALVREEFIRALEPYPDWAVQRAFDTWARTATRRPTPGDIVILASREVEPFHKELARRDRLQALAEAEAAERVPCDPEVAARLMWEAGFTLAHLNAMQAAPMATTFAEAETRTPQADDTAAAIRARLEPGGAWADAVAAARASNPMMQEAMAYAARLESEDRHSTVGLGDTAPPDSGDDFDPALEAAR